MITPEEARSLLNETDLRDKYEVNADLFDLMIQNKS